MISTCRLTVRVDLECGYQEGQGEEKIRGEGDKGEVGKGNGQGDNVILRIIESNIKIYILLLDQGR